MNSTMCFFSGSHLGIQQHDFLLECRLLLQPGTRDRHDRELEQPETVPDGQRDSGPQRQVKSDKCSQENLRFIRRNNFHCRNVQK